VNFEVSITKMYLRIPWELVADPMGKAKHTLGTTALDVWLNNRCLCCETHEIAHIKPCGNTPYYGTWRVDIHQSLLLSD